MNIIDYIRQKILFYYSSYYNPQDYFNKIFILVCFILRYASRQGEMRERFYGPARWTNGSAYNVIGQMEA